MDPDCWGKNLAASWAAAHPRAATRPAADVALELWLCAETSRRFDCECRERADCCFGPAALPSPLAHETIIGKALGGLVEDSRGGDVIEHLISRFAVGDGDEHEIVPLT